MCLWSGGGQGLSLEEVEDLESGRSLGVAV